ncbi:MAG TPA: PQQ-binding-like beta-propeller repeat protein [Thermoanaerobaculia bacterium]|nr:PQQ-binding-like beta-propeller repeat protein [Thermoanaerobaculia bacterium]
MAYNVSVVALPDPNVASGTFVITEVPAAGVSSVTFTCTVTDAGGHSIATVTASTSPASSAAIAVSTPSGASLTASLNYTSGTAQTITLPLPGGSASALSGIRITFTWASLATATPISGTPSTYAATFDAPTPATAYFLSQYAWLTTPSPAIALPQQVFDDFNPYGDYSALFLNTLFGGTTMTTTALAVPSGLATISANFLLQNAIIDRRTSMQQWLAVTFTFNSGTPVTVPVGGDVSLTPLPWIPISVSAPIPSGANSVTITIAGAPVASPGAPAVPLGPLAAMDDLTISFIATPPALPAPVLIYGDPTNVTFANAATGASNGTVPLQSGTLTAPPAVANGIAFCGEGGGVASTFLHAYQAATATDLWNPGIQITGSVDATPALGKGTMYVAASNGSLYGYSLATLATPATLWPPFRFTTATPLTAVGTFLSLDETLVFIVATCGIFAVNVSGTAPALAWSALTSVAFSSSALPAFDGTRIYAAAGTSLYAIDVTATPVNGTMPALWMAANSNTWSAPQLLASSVVLAGDSGGTLHALDILTGGSVWTLTPPGSSPGSIVATAAFANTAVFLASAQSTFYGYTLTSSAAWVATPGWNVSLNGGTAAATVVDGVVYVAGNDGRVHALNLGTGASLWSASTSGNPTTSPVYVLAPLSGRTTASTESALLAVPLSTTYDKVCWLCSHNSYSTYAENFLFAQQMTSIPEQIQHYGVRALMLDVWQQNVGGTPQIVYAHENIGFLQLTQEWTLFSDSLAEIKLWLDANPKEVLTILLEQRVARGSAGQTMLYDAFTKAGLMSASGSAAPSYIYWADRANVAQNGQPAWTNSASGGFPTLQWMIDSGHRLAVFSDRDYSADPTAQGAGWTPPDDGFAWTFGFAVENQYDYNCLLTPFGAVRRSQSQPLTNASMPLFVMNFFENVSEWIGSVAASGMPAVPIMLPTLQWWVGAIGASLMLPATYTHNYSAIMSAVRGAWNSSQPVNRLPNFLAMNFVEWQPSGPQQAVAQINALLASGAAP